MRHVPDHPASTHAAEHNPEAPLVTDLSLDELEHDARRAIGEMAYAYYAGGSDDERLLRDNVDAWARWQLHPRVLAGLAGVSCSTSVLGQPVSVPVAVAPTALQGLAHPDAEVATARGAAEAGALMILSSLATSPLEDVAAAVPDAVRWMQIYILKDRARTADLAARAAANGFGALVLTVDAPVSGLRLREWRTGVRLPDDLALPNLTRGSADAARDGGFMAVVTREFEPALTPDDIGWLAGLSSTARRREGCPAGGRCRSLRRGRRRRGRRIEPRCTPTDGRAADGRHPPGDRGGRRRTGRGLRGRRHPACRPTSSRHWLWEPGPF